MNSKLKISLFSLRAGVFIVMLFWTLDKFVNPDHAAKVFKHFYFISDAGPRFLKIIAAVQLIVVFAFVAGFKKKYTYGLIFAMHLISTLSSFKQYLDPWPNLLFFAAWPMLAACLTLFLLRDEDTFLALDK